VISFKSSSEICEECRFEDVLHSWSTELWPGRASAIEPTSAMKWLGGIDMSLMKSQPTFWRIINQAQSAGPNVSAQSATPNSPDTLGVLSGHFGGWITDESAPLGAEGERRSYRTRGLWVDPKHRGKGFARLLMLAAFKQAKKENCEIVWTFPRKTSMPFYQEMGFKLVGSWIGENDSLAGEFGPNGFALAKADRHESFKTP